MRELVELHPAAIREAARAFSWYAERSDSAAQRFVEELDRAVEAIQEKPASFPMHLKMTRRCLLKRFPYLVVFREEEHRILIVAIAHGRRRPGYWSRRVKE